MKNVKCPCDRLHGARRSARTASSSLETQPRGRTNGFFPFIRDPLFVRKEWPMPEWMESWYFMGGMAVLLIALIGVFLFIRNKGTGDE